MVELGLINAPAFTLGVGRDGKLRYLDGNAAYTTQTGVTTDDLAGRTLHDIHDPVTAAWLGEFFHDAVRERRSVEFAMRMTLPLGDVWWRTAVTPVVTADGAVVTLLGICQDITLEKQLEADLLARNRHLDLAIRMLKGASWQFDVHADRYDLSPNIALLLGEEQPRDVGWPEWRERILPEDGGLASCDELLAGGAGEQVVEFRFRANGGTVRWARCQRVLTTDMADYPVVCGVVVDITAERERAALLELEATRDSLTGLLNRRGLKRGLPAPLPAGTAVVMVDVDAFKQINDTHGHGRGDAVLVEVAHRLVAVAGGGAVVARLGGDEFLAAVPARTGDDAALIRRRIVEALTFEQGDAGQAIVVKASVGLAWRDGAQELADLLAEADDELYRHKRARKAALRATSKATHDDEPRVSARAAA